MAAGVTAELKIGDLQRAIFVWRMSSHKKRVKDETKARQAADVLSACEALVEASLREAFVAGFAAGGEDRFRDGSELFDAWKAERRG